MKTNPFFLSNLKEIPGSSKQHFVTRKIDFGNALAKIAIKNVFNQWNLFLFFPVVNAFVINFNITLSSLLQFCEVGQTKGTMEFSRKTSLYFTLFSDLVHLDFVAQYGRRIRLIQQENGNVA